MANPFTAAKEFHRAIDGLAVCTNRVELEIRLAVHGIQLISQEKQCPLDRGYEPRTLIEKLFAAKFPDGGMNNSDLTFTVAKDGFQTFVFEHAGQMFCSDWIADVRCGTLGFVPSGKLQ